MDQRIKTIEASEGRTESYSMARLIERRRMLLVSLLFGLSGVPALIYQVAWQRILAIHSGVGAFSVTVIVAAYMAGLGVGAQVGGRWSRRLAPNGALKAFAAVELAIGLFAVMSGRLYYDAPMMAASWFQGTSWRVAIAHLVALLPPTLLMGMTFPLLVRAMVVDVADSSREIGRLYGLNLLGAALGAFAAPWFLIPSVGIEGAIRFGSLCNLITALGVFAAAKTHQEKNRILSNEDESFRGIEAGIQGGRYRLLLWSLLYFLSGFTAIALEVVWFRVVDLGAKSTAFTFGTVLALYLAGLALGCLIGVRYANRIQRPLACFVNCQTIILVYTGICTLLIIFLPRDVWGVDWFVRYWSSYEPISVDSNQPWSIFALYAFFPALLFGVPTLLMGLSFTVLQKGVQDDPRTSGFKVGVLQSSNILGCVLGALAVGLLWFDSPGTAGTLRGLVASGGLFALLSLCLAIKERRGIRLEFGLLVAVLLVALLLPSGDQLWLRLHGRNEPDSLLAEDLSGVAALIPEGGRWRMSFNGKGQSHLPFGGVHSKLGALPATLHPVPTKVAIIGLGSGDTAWAAACRKESRIIRVFEVGGSQFPLLRELAKVAPWEPLQALISDKRLEVVTADGRTELAGSSERYDLIEADAIRPNGSYSGNLYSLEFFKLCASKLEPGGLMCSWSPTTRTRATFAQAFPYVIEVDGGVVLIGSNEPIGLDLDDWSSRLRSAEVAAYLGSEVVAECLSALKSARSVLEPAVGAGELNTDLFPRDEYLTPVR